MRKQKIWFLLSCVAASLALFTSPALGQNGTGSHTGEYYLFIGTYASADTNDIYVYRFNPATGESSFVSAVKGIENPSFVDLSPDHRFLYAVSETHGGNGGQVYAYTFDRSTGSLHYLDQQLSGGDDPCNITTDKTGHWLFTANYTSGSFSVFPLEKNGRIDKASRNIQDTGHGVNAARQSGPHVHCVLVAPNNREIYVSDLGLDRLFMYDFDPNTGHLKEGYPPFASVVPGTGSRIPDFSPDGKYIYLITEMGGTITQFQYKPGQLHTLSTVSTVPADFKGKFTGADIHFSPDGKFLYASDRDDLNDIVWYQVNAATGALTLAGRVSSQGKTPRYFLITPDGKYVLVGHQTSGGIVIFRRDTKTGNLTPTGQRIDVPHAVCIKLMKTDS